jgi:hypothetical protein
MALAPLIRQSDDYPVFQVDILVKLERVVVDLLDYIVDYKFRR